VAATFPHRPGNGADGHQPHLLAVGPTIRSPPESVCDPDVFSSWQSCSLGRPVVRPGAIHGRRPWGGARGPPAAAGHRGPHRSLRRYRAGEVWTRGGVCSGGADRVCPHVRGAPGIEPSNAEPLHGALCWPPGGHVHHPGSPAVGDEHEPGPHLWVGVVSPSMDRALALLPRATPRHAAGGGTVCALARRAPCALRET